MYNGRGYTYLLSKDCLEEEYLDALNCTKPKNIKEIKIENITFDFDLGEFVFYIKTKDTEFKISFYKGTESINDFWRFLEQLTDTKETLVLNIFHNGVEVIIYCCPVGKFNIRFVVMNTRELHKKVLSEKILRYSLSESEINIDVIINKRNFIKMFYQKLYLLFKNYENIAYFEPPIIDFDFWIKDSKKIKDYLSIKRKKH